ncbi:unnamed protein product [Rotaria sp. Silwood2]|nr:unnamed protein product [Rotaria sp. Silwood2]CAF3991622.1 unnamed protein product [Rotaria sp. Silwood2]
MTTSTMILTIIMTISLIVFINGNPVKRDSNDLFKEILQFLLETKQPELFDDKLEASKLIAPRRRAYFFDEDERDRYYNQRVVRDKIVGIGDDPI